MESGLLKECTCCQHINLLHFFFFKESRSLKNYFECLCSLTSIPWGQSLSAGPVLFKKAAQDSLMQEGRAGPGTRHRQRGWSPVLREGKWSLRDSARSLCHSPDPRHLPAPNPCRVCARLQRAEATPLPRPRDPGPSLTSGPGLLLAP